VDWIELSQDLVGGGGEALENAVINVLLLLLLLLLFLGQLSFSLRTLLHGVGQNLTHHVGYKE
jgi:hypothetical protein